MFAFASQNPLQTRVRNRRLRFALAGAVGAALFAGSVAVSAQTAQPQSAKPTEAMEAASADVERTLITYQTPTGTRTVRVIPLFKTPAGQFGPASR